MHREVKQTSIGRLRNLGAMVAAILFLSNWPTYSYMVREGPIPLFYFAIPFFSAILLFLLRPKWLIQAWREPLMIWFIVYVSTGTLWLIWSGASNEQEVSQWRVRILSFLIFASCLPLISRSAFGGIATILFAAIALAATNNWIDFLFPYQFISIDYKYANPGRAAGFYLNANQAANAILLMTVIILPFIRERFRILSLLIMGFGVWPTYSRSGIIGAALVVVFSLLLGLIKRKKIAWLMMLAPLAVIAVMDLQTIGLSSGASYLSNVEDRLNFFSTGGEFSDDSAIEREHVVALAIQMFAESPIVGNGIGSTLVRGNGRGTHNMFALLAAEQGLVGLMLYLSFLAYIFASGFRLYKEKATQESLDIGRALILLAIVLTFLSLFSHTLLEDPFTMFALAFIVMAKQISVKHVRANNSQAIQTSF